MNTTDINFATFLFMRGYEYKILSAARKQAVISFKISSKKFSEEQDLFFSEKTKVNLQEFITKRLFLKNDSIAQFILSESENEETTEEKEDEPKSGKEFIRKKMMKVISDMDKPLGKFMPNFNQFYFYISDGEIESKRWLGSSVDIARQRDAKDLYFSFYEAFLDLCHKKGTLDEDIKEAYENKLSMINKQIYEIELKRTAGKNDFSRP